MTFSLPAEIFCRIFKYLSDQDLCSLSVTNRALLALVHHPSTWQERCAQWDYWTDISLYRKCRRLHHYGVTKDGSESNIDWYDIYRRRSRIDNIIRSQLDSYGLDVTKGYQKYDVYFQEIVKYGIEALDALMAAKHSYSPLEKLGNKFLAAEAEGFIRRREAVSIWVRVVRRELSHDDDDAFDLVYSSFAYFCGSGTGEVAAFMDNAAEAIRKQHVSLDDCSMVDVAKEICNLLREGNLMCKSKITTIHNLLAPALDFPADSTCHHLWSICGVFSGIAHRLGFRCSPVSFVFLPMVILHRNNRPDNQLYVSLVNNGAAYDPSVAIMLMKNHVEKFTELNLHPKSFLTAIRHMQQLVHYNTFLHSQLNGGWDAYASHASGLTLLPTSSGNDWIMDWMTDFRRLGSRSELDIYDSDWFVNGIFERYGPDAISKGRETLRSICNKVRQQIENEEMGEGAYASVDSSSEAFRRKFRVGEIVRYNRYSCTGVIVSYRPFRDLVIDTLNQAHATGPFYTVILATGSRVCASQSSLTKVDIIGDTDHELRSLMFSERVASELGRYFARFDESTGLFVDRYCLVS
ncbi:hypothetical protein V1511DRAFT_320729 [Dipodascopsis uninucleata]